MLCKPSISTSCRSVVGDVSAFRLNAVYPNPTSGNMKQMRPNVVCQAKLATTDVGKSTNIRKHETLVPRDHKELLLGQKGCTIWFTGLSGSGKSTVACELEHKLRERGHFTMLLDGDNVRHGLNSNLGFSAEDRTENIRRIGEVAKLTAESGVITLTSFISPYIEDREAVRARMAPGDFIEVFMNIPLSECEARDPKGLYKAARAGKIKNFTGIDDPYEAPVNPEITVDLIDAQGNKRSATEMAESIIEYLEANHYLSDPQLRTIAAFASSTFQKQLDSPLQVSFMSAML